MFFVLKLFNIYIFSLFPFLNLYGGVKLKSPNTHAYIGRIVPASDYNLLGS
jgi:hypothetical protein